MQRPATVDRISLARIGAIIEKQLSDALEAFHVGHVVISQFIATADTAQSQRTIPGIIDRVRVDLAVVKGQATSNFHANRSFSSRAVFLLFLGTLISCGVGMDLIYFPFQVKARLTKKPNERHLTDGRERIWSN